MNRFVRALWQGENRAVYALFMVLFLLCLLLQWWDRFQLFRYNRELIEQGDIWLLFTGHLLHLNWAHFWMNMAGLLLVVLLFAPYYSSRYWLWLLLFSMLFCGLALFLFNPELMFYVGLSGVLHGLFVAGAIKEYRHYPKSGMILMFLIVLKLVWEQLAGALPGSESMAGGRVLVDAHLYGAIAGLIFSSLHQFIHIHDRHQDRQHDQ